jgi:type II secretory pathway component PulC
MARSLLRFSPRVGNLACLVTLVGCSFGAPTTPPREVRIDAVRPVPPPRRVINFQVDKGALARSLERQELLRSIRLVPILRSESEKSLYPEYRIFDLKEGSPYRLLGLENADVLVSSEGYIVWEPAKFTQYVSLLKDQNGASIEIRRGEEHLLLVPSFVGS